MAESQGAMGHNDWINLSWPTFCSYVISIKKRYQAKKDTNYFGSSKLANIWNQKKDEWLKAVK